MRTLNRLYHSKDDWWEHNFNSRVDLYTSLKHLCEYAVEDNIEGSIITAIAESNFAISVPITKTINLVQDNADIINEAFTKTGAIYGDIRLMHYKSFINDTVVKESAGCLSRFVEAYCGQNEHLLSLVSDSKSKKAKDMGIVDIRSMIDAYICPVFEHNIVLLVYNDMYNRQGRKLLKKSLENEAYSKILHFINNARIEAAHQ